MSRLPYKVDIIRIRLGAGEISRYVEVLDMREV